MLIFIDTEFTSLDRRDTKLISMGLVPADGRDEFYAEIEAGSGWMHDDCSAFVQTEVLPLLWGDKWVMSYVGLRERLLTWFAARPRSCQIASDSEIDFRFLKTTLIDAWPVNLALHYFDLRGMIDTTAFNHAAQAYYSPDRQPHHALHDARANRRGWLAYTDAHKSHGIR